MFALLYPREFLCYIYHAKSPHLQTHAVDCPKVSRLASFHAGPLLSEVACKADVPAADPPPPALPIPWDAARGLRASRLPAGGVCLSSPAPACKGCNSEK